MEKLIKGLHKFQTEVFPIQKDFYANLTKGQNPETLFITCSDSRINPNLVTSADPGDMFILRNAGNIIPPHGTGGGEAATLEFAIIVLKVKHIILCGHSHCGALQAVFDVNKLEKQKDLKQWIETYVSPTLELIKERYLVTNKVTIEDILLQEHVLQQIENLKTYPFIIDALAQQEINLHAWIYKFEHGDIFSYNQSSEQFECIKHF